MEAKHTPWPGKYFQHGPDKYGDIKVTSDLGGGGMRLVIATMVIPHPEDVSNDDGSPVSVEQSTGYAVESANLFAAAPDMRDALQHACKHLCQWKDACEMGCPVSISLSKAEGR
jgi:hypothetical protein